MPARDLALERVWRKRMRQYERSGLTIEGFCDQEGLIAHQFSWWRSELKRRDTKSKSTRNGARKAKAKGKGKRKRKRTKSAARFVPVQLESPSGSSVEVVLDQPPRIRISSGFDADVLREVIRVLESR